MFKKQFSLFLLLLSGLTYSIEYELELKTQPLWLVNKNYLPQKTGGVKLWGNFHGRFPIVKNVTLQVDDQFDGVSGATKKSPLTEKLPYVNHLSSSLNYTGFGRLYGGAQYSSFVQAVPLNEDYADIIKDTNFDYANSIERKGFTNAFAGWNFKNNLLNISILSYLQSLSYDFKQEYFDPSTPDSNKTSLKNDNNLWSSVYCGYYIFPYLLGGIGLERKDNFNDLKELNLSSYFGNIQFENKFSFDNILYCKVEGRFLNDNPRVYIKLPLNKFKRIAPNNNYETWIYVRDIQALPFGFYSKVDGTIALGEHLAKHRYEIGLRRPFQNESSFEAGYFTLIQSVFPQQGWYSRSKFVLPLQIIISPYLRATYEGPVVSPNRNEAVEYSRFMKFLGQCDVSYEVVNKFEILAGFSSVTYQKELVQKIPSYSSAYIGLRTWYR